MKKLISLVIGMSGLIVLFKDAAPSVFSPDLENSTQPARKEVDVKKLIENLDTDSFQTEHPQLVATSFNTGT